MINHCNNVILARVSVLKSRVHVCNDFAPESGHCTWSALQCHDLGVSVC